MAVSSSDLAVAVEPRVGRSVSIDHAAALLRVSRRTIYNRIRNGQLRTIRTLGGSQRVLIDSIQVYVLENGPGRPARLRDPRSDERRLSKLGHDLLTLVASW